MMEKVENQIEIHVVGTYLDSDGYPNVRYRLKDFRNTNWLKVTENNVSMWSKGVTDKHRKINLVRNIFRGVFSHTVVMVKYVFHGRSDLVYVPYPSVFVGYFMSLLPRFIRPRKIVLDAFISLYDTVVNDREILSPESWISVLLKKIEKAAYMNADLILVDTPQNVSYLCSEFNLPEGKVIEVPLSTDEGNFKPLPYVKNDEIFRILFVGTFVPLHGVSTILSAAHALESMQNVEFKIIGNGQTAASVMAKLPVEGGNIVWERDWKTPEELASLISEADICLGIFGLSEKTQRVCPFKLYAYAACGRAIITGDTEWAREAIKNLSYKPFETVPVDDGQALADRIIKLIESKEARKILSENSVRFYDEQLSNKKALAKLEVLFRSL